MGWVQGREGGGGVADTKGEGNTKGAGPVS